MKVPKLFLCKKRKNKIFEIKKYDKRNKKNKDQKNSLIEISKLVWEYIKKEEHKTCSEITEYVINILKPETDEKIQKNIQRRVYDSINVMNAAGLIKKNKQDIEYIPLKEKNNDITYINSHVNKINKNKINDKDNIIKIKNKNNEYSDKSKELYMLQKVLMEKYLLLKFNEAKCKSFNENNIKNNNILFTNDLFASKKNKKFPFQITIQPFLSPLNNDNLFHNIKKEMAQEMIYYLDDNSFNNEEKSANNFQIKKNNFNINNINNNKIQEDHFNIQNIINIKKMKYNEDIIFNYLKKLKIFRDELFSFTDIKVES
jgi:hypothetical protein